MHEIKRFLSERCPDSAPILFWSCVVLCQSDLSHITSIEWKPWQCINRDQATSRWLVPSLIKVLEEARDLCVAKRPSWYRDSTSRPDVDLCDRMASLRIPNFVPNNFVQLRDEELQTSTDGQAEGLTSALRNRRLLVSGMAGTGKTVLARKVARLECERGKKVLLLTFNALIAEQIRQDLGLLAGLTVSHLHDHLRVITRAGGGIVGETDTDHFNKVSLPSQACEALLQYETNRWVYDTLVVDEAQDLVSPHYLDFLDLSLTGGLKSGRWLLFGDFERQSIYTDEIEEVGTETDQGPAVAPEHSVLAHMENLGTSVFYHDLSLNCRNSPTLELPIAKLGCLDPFYSGFRRQDREASFGLLFYKDEEDQVELLRRELERLEKAGFQGADIVVLSPTRSSAAARLDPHLSRYTITPDRRGPTYTTVHRFKGLEAKAVVLTDIDHMDTQRDLDLLYIGLTRPLHWVTVLMSERLRDVAKRSGLTG